MEAPELERAARRSVASIRCTTWGGYRCGYGCGYRYGYRWLRSAALTSAMCGRLRASCTQQASISRASGAAAFSGIGGLAPDIW